MSALNNALSKQRGQLIRKEFSAYLDALRFTASIAVVVGHLTFPQFIAGLHSQGGIGIGNVAVATFFVLSGYVIAFVAHEKETTIQTYTISRLARIYSVAVPALLLSLVVGFYLISHGAGAQLPLYEYRRPWKYLVLFLFFGSEVAGFHDSVFGNDVFWSLSYEVWYYALFAILFYLRGRRRLLFGAAVIAILGLPAGIYFPIWLLGGFIYDLHRSKSVAPGTASIGAIGTALILMGLWASGFYEAADRAINIALDNWPWTHLHNATHFPSFYMAGGLSAANIFFSGYCRLNFLSNLKTRAAITYCASFTFAIYLSHLPLMILWAYLIRHDPHSALSIGILAAAVLVSCWCFGMISERQKLRWRSLFLAIFRAAEKALRFLPGRLPLKRA